MRTIYIVKSTLPTIESARDLARILVEEKLAACVQIGARMEWAYAWNGEIRIDEEYPISIKTSAAAMEKLEARFSELHPYECPQWAAITAEASKGYAKWFKEYCTCGVCQ